MRVPSRALLSQLAAPLAHRVGPPVVRLGAPSRSVACPTRAPHCSTRRSSRAIWGSSRPHLGVESSQLGARVDQSGGRVEHSGGRVDPTRRSSRATRVLDSTPDGLSTESDVPRGRVGQPFEPPAGAPLPPLSHAEPGAQTCRCASLCTWGTVLVHGRIGWTLLYARAISFSATIHSSGVRLVYRRHQPPKESSLTSSSGELPVPGAAALTAAGLVKET